MGWIKPSAKSRKRKRAEADVVAEVRPKVEERDGYCRILSFSLDPLTLTGVIKKCEGPSQWAHLPGHRRSQTRGLPPEERHTTQGTVMLCMRHHEMEETHQLSLRPLTPDGADGPMGLEYLGSCISKEK